MIDLPPKCFTKLPDDFVKNSKSCGEYKDFSYTKLSCKNWAGWVRDPIIVKKKAIIVKKTKLLSLFGLKFTEFQFDIDELNRSSYRHLLTRNNKSISRNIFFNLLELNNFIEIKTFYSVMYVEYVEFVIKYSVQI